MATELDVSARYANPVRRIGAVLAVFALVLMTCTSAHGDWMNLTGAETAANIAEIVILDDRVRVRLEVYIRELERFADLIPDELLNDGGAGRPSESDRMANFSANVLSIRGTDGVPLPAKLRLAEPRLRVDRNSPFAGMINPQTRQRVPEAPLDKRVLYAEIDYPFQGRPATLTFSPPLDENGNALATIGFIAYHKAVPVIDFRYLTAGATLILDWEDPWYSRFDNPNLKRHHKNALMSFLYIEPREVRHEVLIRVSNLQDRVDLGLDSDGLIGAEEQASIKKRARTYFEMHNLLRVDGEARNPVSSRAEFLSISTKGVTVLGENTPLELSTAIIGLILYYPVRHIPQSVTVDWELFDERNERIPTTAIDPAGPLSSYVDAADPVIEWQNFLRKYVEPEVKPVRIDTRDSFSVPILSLLFVFGALFAAILAIRGRQGARITYGTIALLLVVGAIPATRALNIAIHNPFAGPPGVLQSAEIVENVLDNVHAAYIEKDDARLANSLSVVVADAGASEVIAELNRALAIKVAGGGMARVNAIEALTVEDIAPLDERAGFRTLASWTARASASHWGHLHLRGIRFRALMELVIIDGTWKIAGMTVVDTQRVS
jgi:hypothetical protein